MILSRNFPSVVFTFFVNRETRQNWKKKIMRVNFFEIESLTHPIDMNWLLSVILFNYQFRQLLVICVIKRTILEWISYSKSNWKYPKWSHEVWIYILVWNSIWYNKCCVFDILHCYCIPLFDCTHDFLWWAGFLFYNK